MTSEIGAQIPLDCYLREGMMLIQYVEMMTRENQDIHPDLVTAFEPYFHDTEIYRSNLNKLVSILRRIALLQSSWKETIFSYDLNSLCAINGIAVANYIPTTIHQPETLSLPLDGHKREILRIGWPEILGGVKWISIAPSKVGFFNSSMATCPIYIQRHALNRIEERLGLLDGIIQEAITESLLADNCNWQRFNEKTLVPLHILNKKVGYLVISYNDNKIIIRSFLFLTNNGTPEGNRLSKLTKLAPQDKKYLDMDTLSGFAGFNFSSDPELAALFRQSGCEDLLKLEDLLLFSEHMSKKKDPNQLMNYLAKHEVL
ncbi:hypothetical protein HDC92_004323 [Pedobacter sp. AK017]|uniref:hypothetical protein n=1 Tax=Pedobacter sp. AK017 TaxID=2723073 RepID=UPI00160AB7A5|nr:hypothetical protein [Pedobacter sp. AK017]MBB5440620.1 hypothetical protein [Pedobacter sp. AK017]